MAGRQVRLDGGLVVGSEGLHGHAGEVLGVNVALGQGFAEPERCDTSGRGVDHEPGGGSEKIGLFYSHCILCDLLLHHPSLGEILQSPLGSAEHPGANGPKMIAQACSCSRVALQIALVEFVIHKPRV